MTQVATSRRLYARDLATQDVRKTRVLRQTDGLEWVGKLREAIEGTDPDGVREIKDKDHLPLTSWSDSSKLSVTVTVLFQQHSCTRV